MPDVPQAVLDQLEVELAAAIPAAVRAAAILEPVYCLRIWYQGCDAGPDGVPWLMAVKKAARRRFLAEHGDQARYFVWGADEATSPEKSYRVELTGERLRAVYHRWFEHMANDGLEDEESARPLREAVQATARRLNRLDWTGIAPVTDDFVVVPADGLHLYMDDAAELLASVTPEQRERLRARGLLPAAD